MSCVLSLFYVTCRTGANPEVRKMAQTVHDMLVVPATTARYVFVFAQVKGLQWYAIK